MVEEYINDVVNDQTEKEDFRDRYIHLLADYQNLQKRTAKESGEVAKRTAHQVYKEFIPLYTDLKAGLKYNDQGARILFNKFISIFMKNQIGVIDKKFFETRCDGKFTDEYAEALSVVATDNPELDNTVAEVIEDGFFDIQRNSIISHAKVTVFKV
jgi:molecular chaperone GrpE